MSTKENTKIQVTFWTLNKLTKISRGLNYRQDCITEILNKIPKKEQELCHIVFYPEDHCHITDISIYLKFLLVSNTNKKFIIISNSGTILTALRLLHVKSLIKLNIKLLEESDENPIPYVNCIEVSPVGELSDWTEGLFREEHNLIIEMREELKKEKYRLLTQ